MRRWGGMVVLALWLGLTAAGARAAPADTLAARADDMVARHVACRMGNGDACTQFSGMVQAIGAPALRQTFADATLACGRGEAKGCWTLAVMYVAGLAHPDAAAAAPDPGPVTPNADDATGVALYQKACDGGFAKACRDLAEIVLLGAQAPRDKARALALYIAACNGGSGQGCADWGNLLEWGDDDIPQNKTEALRLWAKACALGEGRACSSLARKYDHGEFVARDAARALVLYDQACAAGGALGCSVMGYRYAEGAGVPQDDAKADAFYDKACVLGEAASCIELGRRYRAGLGVGADPARAVALFEQGCAGFPRACRDAASAWRDGDGVARDKARAIGLFHRGCALQDHESCDAEAALGGAPGAPPAPKWTPPVFTGERIVSDDYPKAAIRRGEHGLTTVHVIVGVDGGVKNCVATGPSDLLNAQTCRLVAAKFRYLPARNAAGVPVEQAVIEHIMWVLPDRR